MSKDGTVDTKGAWIGRDGKPLAFQYGDKVYVEFDGRYCPDEPVELIKTYIRKKTRWFQAVSRDKHGSVGTVWHFEDICIMDKAA